MAAGNSEYPFGWGAVGMMAADEQLNGMTAAPMYSGAYPAGPTQVSGGGVTVAARTPGMGMPGLLVWGFLFVALILSHTFTFELQE